MKRPLSPHLEIYNAQMSSGLSIYYRFTGIGISGGILLFLVWLSCLALGEGPYVFLMSWLENPWGRFLLIAWTWALLYHLAVGARHLSWDCGYGFELKHVYWTGYAALLFSFGLTALFWYSIW